MNDFRCLSYTRLARSLMEIYRVTPDTEVLSVAAGVNRSSNGVTDIHKAMVEHRATCKLCRKNSTAPSRERRWVKRNALSAVATS